MGTNYYVKTENETLHLGKNSGGVKFKWQTIPKYDLFTREDWKFFIFIREYMPHIYDEYGTNYGFNELLDLFDKDGREDHYTYKDSKGNLFILEDFS